MRVQADDPRWSRPWPCLGFPHHIPRSSQIHVLLGFPDRAMGSGGF